MDKKYTFPTSRFLQLMLIILMMGYTHHGFTQTTSEEDVDGSTDIKLVETKETDLDIEKNNLQRNFLFTNSEASETGNFDSSMQLGLTPLPTGENLVKEERQANNYFSFMVANGFYFLGEADISFVDNNNLLKVHFLGMSRERITSLISDSKTVNNSGKYKIDFSMQYNFLSEGTEYPHLSHTINGRYVGYGIGMQSFRTNVQNRLLLYDIGLEYLGYYRFGKLNLDHGIGVSGGKYALEYNSSDSGFVDLDYNLELSGADKTSAIGGLLGDLRFVMNWIRQKEGATGANNFRFLLGLGIGYDWEVNTDLLLSFYLGQVTEFIKTSNGLEVDAFLPIVVLPQFAMNYSFLQEFSIALELGLKAETEQLTELYEKESYIDNDIFPYLNHLAEAKFVFRFVNQKVIDEMRVEAFTLYDYYFNYDRRYFEEGELIRFVEEHGVHKVTLGLELNFDFLKWLSLYHKSGFNIPLQKEYFFPVVDLDNKLTFKIPPIFSKVFLTYALRVVDRIYSYDRSIYWLLPKHSLGVGYVFTYNQFELSLSVKNILDQRNVLRLPVIYDRGFSIQGGMKYYF